MRQEVCAESQADDGCGVRFHDDPVVAKWQRDN
jgi:hypothetical protein